MKLTPHRADRADSDDGFDPTGAEHPADVRLLSVALDIPLRCALEYLPPPGIAAADVAPGSRVRVPIGRRSTCGVVVGHAAHSTLAAGRLRAAQTLIDEQPLLDAGLMRLLRWTAHYYQHPPGEVIAAALPRALRQGAASSERIELWRITPEGAAALSEGLPERAPARRALLARLADEPAGLSAAALASIPRWRALARTLQQRGWLERLLAPSRSDPCEPDLSAPAHASEDAPLATHPSGAALQLTDGQREAVAQIDAAAGHYAAFVLQGATGSGKTEVYLQCAARALARGHSVLVLVPEIGLTPQLIARFRERFSVRVTVTHSGLSDTARLAAWRSMRSGSARLVLGTRSAIFAPLPALGLIVVDEEHDASYKQHEGGCRYHARDLAVVRARQAQVPVVLGSATPALETLQNVRRARYRPLQLLRRADQPEAPALSLIDLRTHPAHAGLSAPALRALERHLGADRQALVFINRRGYAPTLLCTACGWIAPCEHCDARLTVHRGAGQLRCHHCAAVAPLPARCPRCGHGVKAVGQGTERIEQTLRELFPAQPLARLDRDTAARPGALEQLVNAALSGEARVLIGTQMLTKGHHFPGVSLVLVLNADQGLFSADFRAAERLAQTIVQVAGRAGRVHRRGEVLIQTEFPEHPLLQSLLAGGYQRFADTALAERQAAHWPPFGAVALLRASSRGAEGAARFLSAARACAPRSGAVRLLGPAAAAMARRAGRHHAQLLIESAERGALHRFLDSWLPRIERLPQSHRVRYALDVDPIDFQ